MEDFEDKVDRKAEYRDAYGGLPLLDLVHKMNEIRGVKEEQEERMKKINAVYDVLRMELIPAKMEEEGINSINVAGVGRVSITGDMQVSVKAGMKEQFYEWLHQHRLGSLIQSTINPSTLKAFTKERFKKGEEIPEEYLNVTPISRASITKA